MDGVTGFGENIPPLKQHVIIYFLQKGCSEHNALDFFFHFNERNWENYRGVRLLNWKMTAWEWILKQVVLKRQP